MQVSKWGNSLAVRLPKKLVDSLKLEAGDELVVVKAEGKTLEVARTDRRTEFLKGMEKHLWPALDGYQFDRDEANER